MTDYGDVSWERVSEPWTVRPDCFVCGLVEGARVNGVCRADYHKMTNYGLTKEQLRDFVAQTNCPLCGVSAEGKRFHIDHDHACCSGATSCGTCVRGYICGSCNLRLSKVEEQLDWLTRAVPYLVPQTGV